MLIQKNISGTVATSNDQFLVCAVDAAICTGGGSTAQGKCVYENIMATLKSGGVHAVCYETKTEPVCFTGDGHGGGKMANTLTGGHDASISDYTNVLVAGVDMYNQEITGRASMTMTARMSDTHHIPCVIEKERNDS